MKAMMKKEIYLQKTQYILVGGILIFLAALLIDYELASVFPSGLAGASLGMTISGFSYDELAHSEHYIASLPVKTIDYIRVKYILGTVSILAFCLLGIGMGSIIAQNNPEQAQHLIYASLGGWAAVTFALAFIVPTVLFFGINKIGFIIVVLMAMVFGCIYLMEYILDEATRDNVQLYYIIAAAEFVVIYLSYRLSIVLMKIKRKRA